MMAASQYFTFICHTVGNYQNVAYANPTVLTCPRMTKTMFTYLILVINWVISSAASARKRSEFPVSRDNLQTKWRIYRPVNELAQGPKTPRPISIK